MEARTIGRIKDTITQIQGIMAGASSPTAILTQKENQMVQDCVFKQKSEYTPEDLTLLTKIHMIKVTWDKQVKSAFTAATLNAEQVKILHDCATPTLKKYFQDSVEKSYDDAIRHAFIDPVAKLTTTLERAVNTLKIRSKINKNQTSKKTQNDNEKALAIQKQEIADLTNGLKTVLTDITKNYNKLIKPRSIPKSYLNIYKSETIPELRNILKDLKFQGITPNSHADMTTGTEHFVRRLPQNFWDIK